MRNSVQVSHPATTVTKIHETIVGAKAWGCSGGTQTPLVSHIFHPACPNTERVLTIEKTGKTAKRVVLAKG